MSFHLRAERTDRGSAGYIFNATQADLEKMNNLLHASQNAIVGGISVDTVDLSMGFTNLQVLETKEELSITNSQEETWTVALMSGRDVSNLLTPRTPRQISIDDESNLQDTVSLDSKNREVFIVHGHNHEPMHEVARLLTQLKLTPIILSEQPNEGKTVIEKLERHSSASFAVVLLTPDDMGYAKNENPSSEKPRARQNVILELGFFIGKLGRDRICALKKDDIEIPSDWHGVVYHTMDQGQGWQLKLAKELRCAGFEIDMNQL
jgi:predicted nucleotide-binding protein